MTATTVVRVRFRRNSKDKEEEEKEMREKLVQIKFFKNQQKENLRGQKNLPKGKNVQMLKTRQKNLC